MWTDGKIIVDGVTYAFEAKIYKEPSKFGINGGRISKLIVWKHKELNNPDAVYSARVVLSYDRGWATEEPKKGTHAYKVLRTVLAACELYMKEAEDNE